MDMREATAGAKATPDAGKVIALDFPFKNLPSFTGKRESRFQVLCRRSVLDAIGIHGRQTREVEVCGVLVGNVFRDDKGPWLYVDECIRGEHAANLAAQVTFTSETWTHIHQKMENFTAKHIVGWYHTHPDFGIFLSAADLFIHENFFNVMWQVAYVYDPIRDQKGMFVWRAGQATKEPILVEEDRSSEIQKVLPAMTAEAAAPSVAVNPLEDRVRRLERRVHCLAIIAFLTVLLSLAWPAFWPKVLAWWERQTEAEARTEIPATGSAKRQPK